MSESLDTEQASIVFMGRESFRMKVVATPAGATDIGAIPSAIWEGPTARLVERRNNDRRNSERRNSERRKSIIVAPPQGDPVELPGEAMPAPARNTIIGIALTTFACGLLVATAVARIRGHHDADAPAPIQRAQAVTQSPPNPAAQPTPPPTVVVQPLPVVATPEPAIAAEAVTPPAIDPRPVAKSAPIAKTVARAATAVPVVRARRPAPTPHPASTAAVEPDPFAPAPAKPAKKWVDPFAE